MSPHILSKKTGDSNVTLLKDGLFINLPCEQATNGYLLGKRISWFFSRGSCACYMILHIIEDPKVTQPVMPKNESLWVVELFVHRNI